MKKIILFLMIATFPVLSFSAGKDFNNDDDSHHEQKSDKKNHKDQGKNIKHKNREQGKDIDRPRLRPQPKTVVLGSAAPAPVIINNNNINNNVVSQQQQQVQVMEVDTDEPVIVRKPIEREVQPEPAKYVSTRKGYWDEGGYFGIGGRIGMGSLKESDGASYEKTFNPVGGAFDLTFGYKMPFFRIGGELGFVGFMTEVPPAGSYEKEEDTMSAFTLMPQIFFDMDLPNSRVAPYIGFGAGLSVLNAKYDLYWFSDSETPDKSDSITSANLTYSIMAGVHIGISPDLEFNAGYRFQDYGNVDLLGYNNALYAHEIDLGLVFKF